MDNPSHGLEEGMWRRACSDTWRSMQSFYFWVFNLSLGIFTTAIGGTRLTTRFGVWEMSGVAEAMTTAGIMGGILVAVFSWHAARAPFRQRDEARSAVSNLQERLGESSITRLMEIADGKAYELTSRSGASRNFFLSELIMLWHVHLLDGCDPIALEVEIERLMGDSHISIADPVHELELLGIIRRETLSFVRKHKMPGLFSSDESHEIATPERRISLFLTDDGRRLVNLLREKP